MNDKRKPPGRETGNDDESDLSDVDIIAMTIRHGSDYTKSYLDSLARLQAYEEDDSHA